MFVFNQHNKQQQQQHMISKQCYKIDEYTIHQLMPDTMFYIGYLIDGKILTNPLKIILILLKFWGD